MSNCYKFDLHIHTPASSCYRGARNDSEYLEILRAAKKQEISLIAITDHNTIDGYLHLMEIKEEMTNKFRVLEEYRGSSQQLTEAIESLEQDIALFRDVYIIPGVEVTLDPGIHIQIFSRPQDYKKLSDLLDIVGYTEGRRGSDSDYLIEYDVKRFLDLQELDGLFVVAPHIDSNSGLNNSALSGKYRSEIMRQEKLVAFSCNSTTQREKLESLFASDPNYKRPSVPAFINCSDAHISGEVGKKYSFYKADTNNYDSLLEALKNPKDRILDTDEDYILRKIERLREKEECYFIDSLVNFTEEQLIQLLCASLNAGIENIIFGITGDLKLIGIKLSEEELREKIITAFEGVISRNTGCRIKIGFEHLGNGGVIAIFSVVTNQEALWCVEENNKVYNIDCDNRIFEASVFEIEDMVKWNTINAMRKYDKRNELRVYEIDSKLLSMSNLSNKYWLQQSVYEKSTYLLNEVHLDFWEQGKLSSHEIEEYFNGNGIAEGNVCNVINVPARLDDAILRFSCPSMNLPEDMIEDLPVLESDCLIVNSNGGAHIGFRGMKICINDCNAITFFLKEDCEVSLYAVLAWIKSSLFTWYMNDKTSSLNIFVPEVLREAVIPTKFLKEADEKLTRIVKEILHAEKEFLLLSNEKSRICKECQQCDREKCLLDEKGTEHNKKISEQMKEIDSIFFDMFGFDKDDVQDICNDLNANGIFNVLDVD